MQGLPSTERIESALIEMTKQMTITQDVRDYAASKGLSDADALQQGMQDKAVEFKEKGAQVYHKA